MLDKVQLKNQNKRGVSIVLTVIVLATALFLIFGTVKFLEMTDHSLRLTYIAMQTVQKGRLQIPSKELALESMAVVARANGFEDARPVESAQHLSRGVITFSYETPFSTTPLVRAHYAEGSTLLAGLFRGYSSSSDPGISREQAQSALAGGISNGATLVYADLSDSMRGPEYQYDSGANSRITELLHAFGMEVISSGRNGGGADPIWSNSTSNPEHMCWPIDITDCLASTASYLSDKLYTKAHQCCTAARQNLPAYISAGSASIPARPYRPNHTIAGTSVSIDVDYQTNLALIPYNPGSPASAQNASSPSPTELRLVCNPSVDHLDQLTTITSGPYAGTYGPFPNFPGYRIGAFDLSTCTTPNTPCNRFTNNDGSPAVSFTNDAISDHLFCTVPWHYWEDWRLPRETAPWVGSSTAPEIAQAGGFASQFGLLTHLTSDFFITYKRLTEAFLIAISEFNSNLVFSVFGGANPFGAVQSTQPTAQDFMSGNYELYNGFDATLDIEHEPINVTDTLTTSVPGSGSPEQRIWTSMNLLTGFYRTRFIAHLDRNHFPNLNPGENSPFPFSSHIWPGSEYLMALRNPQINRAKGESVPWGLQSEALSPAHVASFFKLFMIDLNFGTTPVDMMPNGFRPVSWFPSSTGASPMSPRFLSSGSHDLSWWPLKDVTPGGIQTNQDLDVPDVLTYARELFGHGLGLMMGGTHIRSVVKHMNEQADAHAAETGGISGRRWFSIIISDGKPNEPAAQLSSLQAAYPSLMQGGTPFLQPAPEIQYPAMITEINTRLTQFEAKVPALSILLFIEHSPPDAETQTFLNLFDPTTNGGNYKRALFKINYQDVEDFREKYKQALTFISILLKSSTKFVQ